MESNSEWVDDIDSILRKNRERDIIRSAVVIVLLLTTFVLMGYLQKSYWFGVIGLTVFFSIFIITNYLPKRIKLSFSQTLAFQLFKVYNNIAKYDGKMNVLRI